MRDVVSRRASARVNLRTLARRLGAVPWAVALVGLVFTPALAVAVDLIPQGSVWRYLDDGSDQGTAWREIAFADGSWASGPAELGYGDGDETTVVSGGPAGNRHITTYFRHTFNVVDPSTVFGLDLQVLRDDGAVVYLNGTEVFRINMPGGTIASSTRASGAIGGSAERTFQSTSVSAALLVPGDNVVAVEVHQASPTSSDISFNLVLSTAPPPGAPALVRGPYLQLGTSNSMIVRWRTDVATDSRLAYGLAPGSLGTTLSDATPKTEHEIEIPGLSPDTQYFYEVGNAAFTVAGNDADHYFRTSPIAGTPRPTRIWVIGDSGECAVSTAGCNDATAVMNEYFAWTAANGGVHADLVLLLGDNAYTTGTDTQHTKGLFEAFGPVLRNHVMWPVPGNHEFGASDSPTQSGPYYEAFTLPTAAEAGGLASGTEAYYSFDFANIHFVALDSHDTPRTAPANPTTNVCPGGGGGGTMYNWLCADLASTNQDWIFTLWHHPPYTKGSHDSDLESHLFQIRERFNPVLEAHGADLNLTGHSHSYERSILIDSHYGTSNTFDPAVHAKDVGNGDPLGDGAYEKPALGPDPHQGMIYSVVGSSSKNQGGLSQHAIMTAFENIEGSLVLDVNANQLDGYFIDKFGNQSDHFRVLKGTAGVCGDGTVDAGEQCDDGNTSPGDCCSATCEFEAAGSVCDDGLFCSVGETCSATGVCGGSSARDCSASADVCNAGVCNEAIDACEASPANEGGACDDGLFCNVGEVCTAGACGGGASRGVEDGVSCTIDSCDEAADVVVNTPSDALCSNDLFCDGSETCDATLGCQAGVAPTVEDGVSCTIDSCDEAADVVVNAPSDALCSNDLFCDGAETCDAALGCQAGVAPTIDDAVLCTADSCDEALGAVVNSPSDVACDDLDPCTADSCDAITGCGHTPIPGCGEAAPVPSASYGGRLLLVAGLLLIGLGWMRRAGGHRV